MILEKSRKSLRCYVGWLEALHKLERCKQKAEKIQGHHSRHFGIIPSSANEAQSRGITGLNEHDNQQTKRLMENYLVKAATCGKKDGSML